MNAIPTKPQLEISPQPSRWSVQARSTLRKAVEWRMHEHHKLIPRTAPSFCFWQAAMPLEAMDSRWSNPRPAKRKRPKVEEAKSSTKLVCPFAARKAHRGQACLWPGFPDIARLHAHLKVAHKDELAGNKLGDVKEAISRHRNGGTSREEKWRVIYSTIFPEDERVPPPFLPSQNEYRGAAHYPTPAILRQMRLHIETREVPGFGKLSEDAKAEYIQTHVLPMVRCFLDAVDENGTNFPSTEPSLDRGTTDVSREHPSARISADFHSDQAFRDDRSAEVSRVHSLESRLDSDPSGTPGDVNMAKPFHSTHAVAPAHDDHSTGLSRKVYPEGMKIDAIDPSLVTSPSPMATNYCTIHSPTQSFDILRYYDNDDHQTTPDE